MGLELFPLLCEFLRGCKASHANIGLHHILVFEMIGPDMFSNSLMGSFRKGSLQKFVLELGVARGLLQEKPMQFQHGNIRVESWQPISNFWSTSSQPDFVRALGRRKTARNSQSKILYTELLKSWPTLGKPLANSLPHGKLQGSS